MKQQRRVTRTSSGAARDRARRAWRSSAQRGSSRRRLVIFGSAIVALVAAAAVDVALGPRASQTSGAPFAVAVTVGGRTIALVTRMTDYFRSDDGGRTWRGP